MRKYLFNLKSDQEMQHMPEEQEQITTRDRLKGVWNRLQDRFTHEEILPLAVGAIGTAMVVAAESADVFVGNETVTDVTSVLGIGAIVTSVVLGAAERITR